MSLESISIGVDIEQISRFRNKPYSFYEKIFTESERRYCDSMSYPEQHFAARFCAKEAFIKALSGIGSDTEKVSLDEIEIYHDERGCPQVRYVKEEGIVSKISLSHDEMSAVACVIVSRDALNLL